MSNFLCTPVDNNVEAFKVPSDPDLLGIYAGDRKFLNFIQNSSCSLNTPKRFPIYSKASVKLLHSEDFLTRELSPLTIQAASEI